MCKLLKNLCVLLVLCATSYAATSNDPQQNDWVQGGGNGGGNGGGGADVDNERPRTPRTASYTFTRSGSRLTGGDRGGNLEACGLVQIGAPCDAVKVSEPFAEYFMEHFPDCVKDALKAQGIRSNPEKIIVKHMGTYNNRAVRGGSNRSMHSTGRSIDISRLEIRLANGQSYNINMTIGSKNKPFYKEFVQCWRKKTAARPSCPQTGARGVLDCNSNRLHHDHVHLSMPFCPRQRGIAGT